MIITITLNPAIDKTMKIDNFKAGKVNREFDLRIDAAGKGINVAKVIQSLGNESKAIGILAGDTGRFIEKQLNRINLNNEFIMIEGETRTNVKIVDSINNIVTDINERGPFISEEDLKEFENIAIKNFCKDSIVVLSGSVPRNVDNQIYKRLIKKAKEKGAKTILDADGELLLEGLKEGPYLVKPNIYELEKLFSKKIESLEDIINYGKKILNYGVELVVVSRGAEGSVFINKNETIVVKGLNVSAKSTVGAGDSMVAGIALAMERGYDFEDMIRLSVATSTASVMTDGTQAGRIEDINKLMDQVEINIFNK